MTAKLVKLEAAPDDAPSVEEHLLHIRETLAAVTVLHAALRRAGDLCLDEDITAHGAAKVADMCEDAYRLAQELAQAIPVETTLLRIVRSKGAAR